MSQDRIKELKVLMKVEQDKINDYFADKKQKFADLQVDVRKLFLSVINEKTNLNLTVNDVQVNLHVDSAKLALVEGKKRVDVCTIRAEVPDYHKPHDWYWKIENGIYSLNEKSEDIYFNALEISNKFFQDIRKGNRSKFFKKLHELMSKVREYSEDDYRIGDQLRKYEGELEKIEKNKILQRALDRGFIQFETQQSKIKTGRRRGRDCFYRIEWERKNKLTHIKYINTFLNDNPNNWEIKTIKKEHYLADVSIGHWEKCFMEEEAKKKVA